MMRRQRGLIDPYTLGFLLALLGTAIILVKDDPIAATNDEAQQVVGVEGTGHETLTRR